MSYELKFKNKKELVDLRYVLDSFILPDNFSVDFDEAFYLKQMKNLKQKITKLLHQSPIKTSSRKAKGRELQKWVCEKIANIFNIKYNQSDDNCDIHSREMGQSGVDVILRGEIYKKFPFDIECKATEKFTIYKDIKQAENNTKENRDWLLIHKKKHSNPIVIMDWEAFYKIIRKNL